MKYIIKEFINQGNISLTIQNKEQYNDIFQQYQHLSNSTFLIENEEEQINKDNEIIHELQQQYHLHNIPQFKILYDNDSDSFDGKTIFSKIKGRKNIHFILKTSISSSTSSINSTQLKEINNNSNQTKQLPLISLPPAIHFFGFYHSKIPTRLQRDRMKCDCILFKFNKKVINNECLPLILKTTNETIDIDFNFDPTDSTLLTIYNSLILRKDYSAVLPLIKHEFHVVNTDEDVHFNASTLTGDRSFHIERLVIIETYERTLFQF